MSVNKALNCPPPFDDFGTALSRDPRVTATSNCILTNFLPKFTGARDWSGWLPSGVGTAMSSVKLGESSPRASKRDNQTLIPIGEMARTFDVTLRTLRFYEDRRLLVPRREGTARYYSQRDKTRLESILRCKQLGFTLSEIRDMIDEADKKPASGGLKPRQDQIESQIANLERQRQAIEGALSALRREQRTLQSL